MNCKSKTIVLIDPPYYRLYKDTYGLSRLPLSLGYLSGAIRKETDWRVIAYNADFRPNSEPFKVSYLSGKGFYHYLDQLKNYSAEIWKEIERVIRQYDPDVVGISCKSQTFSSACRVARIVKSFDPKITVIAGGAHVSMVGAKVLEVPDIDLAIRGEGEIAIVQVLKAIEEGKSFQDISGVDFKSNGQIIQNGPSAYIEELDTLCFPHEYAAEVLHDYDRYPPEAFSHIFAIRGCPYNCFFCGSQNVWGRKVRFRSVANVIAEIKSLQKKGISSIHFDDDTFGVNSAYISELCHAIETECPGLQWSCELHVRLVTDVHIAMMKKAGCFSIQLGIESGNNQILNDIRKGFKIDQAIEAVETIRRHDVAVQAFFIVGFPQETEESLKDTVSAMKQIRGRLSYSIFTPYPGTEAFDFCLEHGLVDEKFDVSIYNHQSPENCFCMNIPKARFRKIVSDIERMVDRNNYPSLLSRAVTKLERLLWKKQIVDQAT